MKLRQKIAYMKTAKVFAELSYCKRRQVGCVIVKGNNIVSIGYNGTPSGHDNCCEDEDFNTKSNVIHAEANALRKIRDAYGCTVFVTTAPCLSCAKLLVEAGIDRVYYSDIYRSTEGLFYLNDNGVFVERLEV